VQRSPWTFTTDPAEQVHLQIDADAADIANEDFGRTAVKQVEGATTLVTFDCGNFDFAVSKILAAKGSIRVVRGETLLARLQAELAAVAGHYA
jgi:hypothetical protein